MRESFIFICLSLSLLAAPCLAGPACQPMPPAAAQRLTLPEVLSRANDCHPDVRAARAALEAAQADVLTASQRANPQLTIGAGSLSKDGVGSGSLWNKTFDHQLRIDQLIERGSKPALRQAAAQSLREASEADLADAHRLARLSATRAYVDLWAAIARLAELEASITLNDASQRALEQRAKAGDAAPLDATRFSLDATRARAEARQTQAEVRAARLQLATLIGAEGLAEALTPVRDWFDAPSVPAVASPATNHRPDVQAAQARFAAAKASAALAQAQQTRDLSVGAQLSHYPSSASNTAGTGNTLSVSVTIPLFVRHAYDGEIARAMADLRSAEESLQRVETAAAVDSARATSDLEAADNRLALVSKELIPAAERVAAGAELAWRRGATGVLDVLDARRSLRAAHIERINAQAERVKAAAQLDAAASAASAVPTR